MSSIKINDGSKEAKDEEKKASEDVAKAKEKELKTVEELNKEVSKLKGELKSLTSVVKDVVDENNAMIGEMHKLTEILKAGISNQKVVGTKVIYSHGSIRSADLNKVSQTFWGKFFAVGFNTFRRLYNRFPIMSYKGSRIMSAGLRGAETLAENVGSYQSGSWKDKWMPYGAVSSLSPISRSEMMSFNVGDTSSLMLSGHPLRKAGMMTEGVLRGIGTKVGGMLFAVQGIGLFLKAMMLIFGGAAKMLQSVYKMFSMSVMLIIKPIFDLLSLALLPLAVFMMALSGKFYKWFIKSVRGFIRGIVKLIPAAFRLADAVSGWIGDVGKRIGGFLKWINGGFGAFIKSAGDFFKFIGKIMNMLWKGIKPVFDFVFKIFMAVLSFASPITLIMSHLGVIKSIVNVAVSIVRYIINGFLVYYKGLFMVWSILYKTTFNIISYGFNMVVGIVRSVIDAIFSIPQKIADAITGGIGNIGKGIANVIPHFQSGGFVPNTTLAVVHAGEYVVPRHRVGDVFNNSESKNISVNITVNASGNMNVDELVDEIERRLRGVVSW